MSQMTRDDVRERLGNIDQIRDIIFGAQIRDYDNRFCKLETDISRFQQETRSHLEQLKVSFSTELKSAVEGIDKKIKLLSLSTQEEVADLSGQIDRINRKFSSTVQSLDEELDKQNQSIKDEISQNKNQVQEEITALRDLILEELDNRFSDLSETKVSKDDIAETLFALGMRLKGTEVIPKLREAIDDKDSFGDVPLLETSKLSKILMHNS
jgi:phosphoglycerate-specific signal transduction histidine kinase